MSAMKSAPRSAQPPVRAALPPAWSVAFSPDGKALAVGSYRKVQLWSLADGAKLGEWPVSDDAVRAVAFAPDGRTLAVGSGSPGSAGVLLLLDTRSGKILQQIKAHDDTVEALAFSGSLLLSAGDDERVVLTDTNTGKRVGALTEHIGRCLSVAVPTRTSEGSGGAIFATGGADKMLKIWDADLRRVVVNFDQCQSPVWCLASLPQPGRFLAGCGDGAVRLFQVRADRPGADTMDDAPTPGKTPPVAPKRAPGQPAPRTGRLTATLGGHDGPVYAVAASPNGNWLASGGADRRVLVWNKDGGRVREHGDAKGDIWGLAISANSRWLAAASLDGRTRVYDLADGSLTFTLPPLPKGNKP